ncbi:2-hydroxyacid dehydrogenase [Evtepia sp.]
MKIALLEPLGIPAEVLAQYQAGLEARGHTMTCYGDKTTDPAELLRRTGDSDIAIIANNPYPASVVEGAPNLKLLNVAFTGVDHVALDACRAKGVTVCNAAGYSTQCVAELALGLAVACLRQLPPADAATRQGGSGAPFRGREIAGRTVGIVGTGAIGTRTAQLFQAFGAKVIAYSRTRRPEVEGMGVTYVSLEELMAQSDIVSIHVPNNAQTKGMISRDLLARMKDTAILLNVARGAIVDNAALADALNQGKLAGAGIDVFDMEPPLPADYPLLHAKNTVLTPHVAFATEESMLRRAEIVFRNVDAFLAGAPENVVPL